MKVFVATRAGGEEDDYSHTVDGELVRLPVTCDTPGCDCGRAMTGMASGQATTMFTIRDLDISRDMYRELLWSTLLSDGWVSDAEPDDAKWVEALVVLHLDLAGGFEVGVPLRLNGDRLHERR